MSEFPTTPVRGEARTDYSGSRKDEVVLQGNEGLLKVHLHGLSANKKLESDVGEDTSLEPRELSDESLDCVKRSQEEPQDVVTCGSGQKNALDQIDINRMFSKNQGPAEGADDSTIFVKHSPMKLDMSSPVKQHAERDDVDGPQPKRLKLELECVPDLAQPRQMDAEESPVGSPEAIEMLDAKSSPMKEFSQVVFDPDEKDVHELGSGVRATPARRSSGLHTLSPVHPNNGELSPFELNEGDGASDRFHMLTRRNEELVEQVHVLNQKLNEIMATCDTASYRYNRMKLECQAVSNDCESRLEERDRELQLAIEERDKFGDKTTRLQKRIDENRDEVDMLKQNQSILQRKYTSLMEEVENARKTYEELESKHQDLTEQYNDGGRNIQRLKGDIDELSTRLSTSAADNKTLQELHEDLTHKLESAKEELGTRNNEIEKLRDQLKEAVDAERGANDQVAEQINALVAQRAELESQLAHHKVKSEADNEKLASQLEDAEEHLKSKTKESQELKERVEQLVEASVAKDKSINEWRDMLDEANDLKEINQAQVKELQNNNEELERHNSHLESSVANLEEELRELLAKFEEQAEKQKLSVELETIQLKNSNIEAEHLAELEQLHSNLSSLQEDLQVNSKILNELRNENESLTQSKQSLQKKLDEALQKEAKNDDRELMKSLQKELESWKEKYNLKEQESNRSLKLLAEDLYIQYSSKHEQKVKLLKKGYETKFQGKLDKLMMQNEGLSQEIEQVKSNLASERKEKQKLIDLLESRKDQG